MGAPNRLAVEEGVRIILSAATRRLASFRGASGPRAPGEPLRPFRNRLTSGKSLPKKK